jgi:hypothetical protein
MSERDDDRESSDDLIRSARDGLGASEFSPDFNDTPSSLPSDVADAESGVVGQPTEPDSERRRPDPPPTASRASHGATTNKEVDEAAEPGVAPVPWYRKRWLRVVGVVVGLLIVTGLPARIYNEFQLNQIDERLGISEEDDLSTEDIVFVSELDFTDRQATEELRATALDMGFGGLTDAEVIQVKSSAIELTALVAGDMSCDDMNKWIEDKYVNALGIVDVKGASLVGLGVIFWGDAETLFKIQECAV